ncbi:dTMP kinase [Actinoallomurus purpureus]|uniref:dTMP kinase n=1 Tax=Actinoallomurus purpureus TaxID=478114 RepID=UPI0020929573|nr:dTMP kinase [Actinoallomurus purpureus]MCO6005140.1 dTMP kinase [Actinoallomurus purpureus]
MTTTGYLITIDGPGCAGKSTLTQLVVDRLAQVGLPALATTEPSKGPAGRLARHHTAMFRGYALACLVTADRYHHLETEIQPALNSGTIVVCDRYVPSSHVLQILDGVGPDFVTQINAHATPPDLAVILTCDEAELRRRLTIRGSHGRFEDDPRITLAETRLYRDVADMLARNGIPVLLLDSTKHDADFLARQVVTSIQTLRSPTHQ